MFTYILSLLDIFVIEWYVLVWASLVAQMIKTLPAMQETPIRFLSQEAPLEKR